MKQIIIAKNKAYATAPTNLNTSTAVADGVLGIYELATGALVTGAKVAKNFCVVLGRTGNAGPIIFPEVDVKTLSVTKTTNTAATTFKASLSIPNTVVGKEYTIIIAKKGVVFHERNKWTATAYAKSTTSADVIDALIKQINASSETSGVKASKASNTLTIEAVNAGEDYEVIGADELTGSKFTSTASGIPAVLDKKYVQDLALACAAGKGFNYLAEDGAELYPGFPESVEDVAYTMYTLRFAVPRAAAKQRDEVVYQTLHIVIPAAASSTISALDTVLGLTSAPSGTSEP